MRFYGDIQKVDTEQRMVWGYASTEAVDISGEIILKSAVEDALEDYMKWANVREMHRPSAVGTTEEATIDDKGLYIGAKIVDDTAWAKVVAGVYKGFSIGGKALARDPKKRNVVTKMALLEISLADRPQNPETKFDIWKASGAEQKETSMKNEPALGVDNDGVEAPAEADQVAKATEAESAISDTAAAVAEDTAEESVDPVAKATGAFDALAAAIESAAPPAEDDLAKAIGDVSRFADILQSLSWHVRNREESAKYEKDDSPIPGKLRSWLSTGAGLLKDVSKEEADKLIASGKVTKAVEAADIAKAAVETTDGDPLAKAVEALAKLEGERDGLAKAIAERDDALNKIAERIDPLVKTVETLAKRLAVIEAEPAPAKTAGHGVALSKEADAAGAGASISKGAALPVEDIKKALDEMSPEERAHVIMKAAMSMPVTMRI